MRFYHHSRDSRYRMPQGAVIMGSTVTISGVLFDCDDSVSITLRFFTPQGQTDMPMICDNGSFSATVTTPTFPCLCHYDFCINVDQSTCFYSGYSGEGRLLAQQGERFQITVYDPNFKTPEWFCEGIAYQIFPDRFCCSDPQLVKERAMQHEQLGRSVFLHENWNEEPLYLPHGGQDCYAPDDYFGGDLAGIIKKLPYLKELGVSCIYLNPIFEAASNHRYNTGDYKKIDPLLGTNEDFAELAKEAKRFGIHLILDGVFSHTGDDSLYFNRYQRYDSLGAYQSVDSPYYSWYRFGDYPDKYECWWGFESLPNVEELSPSYGDFICGTDGVLAHWQGLGADGWRLDVADELPDDFIRSIYRSIKRSNPDALVLGEVWEDCSNKMGSEGRRGYVNGDLLDGAMNYPFRKATLAFIKGEIDAYAYNDQLQTLFSNYPKPFLRSCLNLLSSHDEVRALTYLCQAPEQRHTPREKQALYRADEEQLRLGKMKLVQAMSIMFTMMGVPCIYYGDEAGLEGMKDPFNRRTYPWNSEDNSLLEATKRLTTLRQSSQALKMGHSRMGALTGNLFALIRYLNEETVVVFVNAGDTPSRAILYPALLSEGADVDIPVSFSGEYTSLDGEKMKVDSVMQVEIAPHGCSIWRKYE